MSGWGDTQAERDQAALRDMKDNADWLARIRAEHERLGDKCPCGNGGKKESK